MRHSRIAPAVAALALAVVLPGSVRAAELDLPSFSHLQQKAVEAVDITIGALPLFFMRHFLDEDDDPESAAEIAVLKGLRSVRVRSYRFDSDFAYSQADLDAVREQLKAPGWSQLAQVRDRKQNEAVDVYIDVQQDKIKSLAVVVSEPREFTIVYLVGTIDLKQLDQLQDQLHLPKAATEQMSHYTP